MSSQIPLPERVKQFYEQLNTQGESALTLLRELYTPDILFISPIEVRHGLGVFHASWQAAFKTYKVAFTDVQWVGTEDDFALFYIMTTYMGIGEPTPMRTSTRCRARDGKVYVQTDYWDTIGGLSRAHAWLRDEYLKLVAAYLGDGPPTKSDEGLLPYIEDDGCYHPESEEQIQALVRAAYAEGGKIRVAGSGHSVWEAIVSGKLSRDPEAKERLLVLDRYKGIQFDESSTTSLVTVDAGCYLGGSPFIPVDNRITKDKSLVPINVTTGTPFKDSLCFALQQKGYALPDLGGISHQSVGGFLSTGSAGGTCKYSLLDQIQSLRVIDGRGNAVDLSPDGPNAEWFAAAGIGMGLCGIISKVTLRCIPTFNIAGKETTAPTATHPDVDFYGADSADSARRPSLAKFLSNTDYTRMMWWPQKGFDRLVVWQATRLPATEPFVPKPYVEARISEQIAGSLMYTILGNLDDIDVAEGHLATRARLSTKVRSLRAQAHAAGDPTSSVDSTADTKANVAFDIDKLKKFVAGFDPATVERELVEMVARAADDWLAGKLVKLPSPLLSLLELLLPTLIPKLLGIIVTDNDTKNPPQEFQDTWCNGLPMDNQMDDVLMPTWFTEIWIPYSEAGGEVPKAIDALRKLFKADGSDAGAYAATGPFCIELYATGGSTKFSLNPAFGDRNVLRVDVFWFALNSGNPLDKFYPAFWKAFDEAGLEYRFHWGKFLPRPSQMAPGTLTARYPEWDKFTRWRKQADPKDVFLSDYWRTQLGL